jgi:hypothetical protein
MMMLFPLVTPRCTILWTVLRHIFSKGFYFQLRKVWCNYYLTKCTCSISFLWIWTLQFVLVYFFPFMALIECILNWVFRATHNPKDEGGTFLRNFGNQLPDHEAQQSKSTTITRWEPQITVFVLLGVCVFLSACFIFLTHRLSWMHDWLFMKAWSDKILHYIWRQSPCKHITLNHKRKWEYCSELTVGTQSGGCWKIYNSQ